MDPDVRRQRNKARYQRRKEDSSLKAKAHYAENKEKIKARVKVYREKNKEECKRRAQRWRASNPETVRAVKVARRAREKGAPGAHTAADRVAVFEFYGYRCVVCAAYLGPPGKKNPNRTLDHIQPLVLGGQNSIDNLQPMCRSCNSSKGGQPPSPA